MTTLTGIHQVHSRISEIMSTHGRAGFGTILATHVKPHGETSGPPEAKAAVAAALPAGAELWTGAIDRAARQAGIDPKLLTAVVWTESSFRPNAVSAAGAIGLTQLMPGTASILGVDPYDPEQNLEGGARHLAWMIERFGRTDLALAAYNAGPARVASLDQDGPGVPVSQDYVDRVLDRYQQLGGTP